MANRTKYDAKMPGRVREAAKMGATDVQLARILGIAESTLNVWKQQFPAFKEAMDEGKAEADTAVTVGLYKGAVGYSHPDIDIRVVGGKIVKTKIVKHYPPNPTQGIFWLKNRRPDLWRDRIEHTGKDGGDLIPKSDPLEVARSIGFILATAAAQNGAS